MNIQEIKSAVDAGHRVFWKNTAYEVIKDSVPQYLIKCHLNDHCIGLHGLAGTQYANTLNGAEEDFFIERK